MRTMIILKRMIKTKQDLHFYLQQDLLAWGQHRVSHTALRDKGLQIQIKLRRLEYIKNCKPAWFYRVRFYFFVKLCQRNGIEIFCNCFGPGLYIPHPNGIVVHENAKIGKNCKIQQGVTIGQTSGNQDVATIGDNVFIGSGAKIIGKVTIANDVAIGANAVVTHDITEAGTTWGGIPARKISDKSSRIQLTPALFNEQK
jgi:serine O-acetyltransferase